MTAADTANALVPIYDWTYQH